MKKILNKQKGITIIALVVTIVVLLILAGVSIVAITGDTGIIVKSDEAKMETEISQYREQLEVIKHEEYAGDSYTINVDEFLDKYVIAVKEDKMFHKAKEVTADHDSKVVIVVTKEGYRFEVTIDDVTYVGNDNNGEFEVDISKVRITIITNPKSWTNGKVRARITSNITRVEKEYSLDGGHTWHKYEKEIEISDNGTEIQARGVNEKNERTEVVTSIIDNIDRLAPNVFEPKVRATTDMLEITATTTDKEATIRDGKSGIKGYKFSKDNGTTWSGLKSEGVYKYENLQPATTYPIKVKAIDNAGNEIESNTINGVTKEEIIVPDGEGRIKFTKEPEGWTKGPVKVSITTEEVGYGIEYSLDGNKYLSYDMPVEVVENKIIYARLTKEGTIGKSALYSIDNIDRLEPKAFGANITEKTSNTITVVGNTIDAESTQTDGSSGVRGYKFSKDNGQTWTEEKLTGTHTFTGLNSNTSYQIKIKAIDKAGNERDTATVNEVTMPIPNGEGNITITSTPTDWTKGPVKVNITSELKEYELQYSKDNSNWQNYTGEIDVVNNGEIIYARFWNGNEGGNSTRKTIDNIDKIPPKAFSPEVKGTSNTVTVVANAIDAEATQTSGKSGIRGYRFSKDNGQTYSAEQAKGTYTFTGLTAGTRYPIKVKAIDKAGNEFETAVKEIYTNPTVKITKQPVNQTVVSGNSFSFTIAATGTGNISFQWYYSATSNSPSDWKPGQTGTTYSNPSNDGLNGRYFYCKVTATIGGVSTSVDSNIVKLVVQKANYSTLKSGTNTFYNTLQNAIAGATSGGGDTGGGTITVLNTLTDNSSAKGIQKNIKINTNGKTLTMNSGMSATSGSLTIGGKRNNFF